MPQGDLDLLQALSPPGLLRLALPFIHSLVHVFLLSQVTGLGTGKTQEKMQFLFSKVKQESRQEASNHAVMEYRRGED